MTSPSLTAFARPCKIIQNSEYINETVSGNRNKCDNENIDASGIVYTVSGYIQHILFRPNVEAPENDKKKNENGKGCWGDLGTGALNVSRSKRQMCQIDPTTIMECASVLLVSSHKCEAAEKITMPPFTWRRWWQPLLR